MHKLLQRQLRRYLPAGQVPPELQTLMTAIDEAYRQSDEDRRLLERSLDLMSQELLDANAKLRADLAAQTSIQAELEQRRTELMEITERSPFPTAVRRGPFFAFVNEAWAACMASTPEAIIGHRVIDFVHPDDQPRAAVGIKLTDEGAPSPPTEVRFKRKTEGWVELEVHPVRNITFEGERSALLLAIDVTERKRLRARIMSADRMVSVGTLAAGVAHEINTPLAYVKGNLDYLAEELPSLGVPYDVAEAVRDAREGANRVARIVGDLKTFSRADEHQSAAVDIHAVLDSASNMARNEIRHKAALVKTYGPVAQVWGDEGKLGQVFLNLLINAAQAMPDGAADRNEIRLVTREDESGRVVVEVIDTGPGIPDEIRSRIFDPFFTTKSVGGGTGLGLYICQGIVGGHKGELEVESEVGRGTTFRVSLPRAKAAMTQSGEPVGERPAAKHGSRVLVVDDEPGVGAYLRRMLGREHDIEVVTDAREALTRCVAGEEFDVLLCDVMMPAMTGADLYRALEPVRPKLAAEMIFMSGGVFSAESRKFLDHVPNRRIDKPIDIRRLRGMLDPALAQTPDKSL